MTKFPILLTALLAFTANAQSQSSDESLESKAAPRAQNNSPIIKDEKPNQVLAGRLTFSGIAVEALKIDNPLQLINPAAPLEYGWAEQNLVRDSIERNVSGLKIFSIEF